MRFKDAEAIADGAAERNEAQGISGVLLYTPSHFVQALEGPKDAVLKTFQRISADMRHEGVLVVSEKPVGERLFRGWGMRAAMMPPDAPRAMLESLDETVALSLLKRAASSL